jgi:hypothetical protein
MKKIWITALDKDQENVQRVMVTLKNYGLGVDGHFWTDDLAKMAWDGALEPLSAKETVLWIITGAAAQFAVPTIRQGLSMLTLALQHRRGVGFPILLLPTAGELDGASLPTLLKGADILSAPSATLGPKIVALANKPVPAIGVGYRLNIHAIHGIGLWYEIGPPAGGFDWPGAMFGVHGADIDFHGVGPADGIPERTVLEYALKGMKIQLGEDEFTAWAAQNRLDGGSSYYVRVQGTPDKLIFGPFAEGDDAEVHVVNLS